MRIEKVLKQLDIWQYRDRNPFELSGGQMQRVAIASILVMQPEVMILDEPTSQLDPEGTEEVFRVVEQLSGTGKTIIMVEQKLEKMAKYCDRLILMHDGKVVDFDTPEKIFARDDLGEIGYRATGCLCEISKHDVDLRMQMGPIRSRWSQRSALFHQQEGQMKLDMSIRNCAQK